MAVMPTPTLDPDTWKPESLGFSRPELVSAWLSELATACACQPVVVGFVSMLNLDLVRCEIPAQYSPSLGLSSRDSAL